MTTVKIGLIVFVLLLASASNAFAYGGGSGFPPGHVNKPGCHLEKKVLPNNKEVTVSNCSKKSFTQRVKDFLFKVKNGR